MTITIGTKVSATLNGVTIRGTVTREAVKGFDGESARRLYVDAGRKMSGWYWTANLTAI